MILTDWLLRSAEHHGASVALEELESGRIVTYAELDRRASRLARAMLGRFGLMPGARVAILSHNRAEYIEALHGCAKAGLVLVCLNWRLALAELLAIVEDSTPSLLIYEPEFEEAADAIAARGCRLLPMSEVYEAALEEAGGTAFAMPPRPASDLWHLLYTSGTTGRPKGVMQSFGMIHVSAMNTFVAGKVLPGEVFLNVLPFFHTGGINLYTAPVLMLGGRVLIERRFDPALTLARLSRDATSMFAVPAIYLALAQHPDFAAAAMPQVRDLSCGGAPIPEAIGIAFRQKGVQVTPSYGMTEAGPTVFAADAATAAAKPRSVGKPTGLSLIRIVDDEGHEIAGDGTGELQLGGPIVTPGYWNRPDATAEAIRDGWLRTGDVAYRDQDGDIFIVDRLKDMFISGGENVYPAEIENLLHGLPGIAEAAVIGVADARWGEVGLAILVPRDGAQLSVEAVLRDCRVGLAAYKVPRHVRMVEALPRTPSGKVEKHRLRELFATVGTEAAS